MRPNTLRVVRGGDCLASHALSPVELLCLSKVVDDRRIDLWDRTPVTEAIVVPMSDQQLRRWWRYTQAPQVARRVAHHLAYLHTDPDVDVDAVVAAVGFEADWWRRHGVVDPWEAACWTLVGYTPDTAAELLQQEIVDQVLYVRWT